MMFINIKLSKVFKIFFVIVVIFMVILFGIVLFRILNKSHRFKVADTTNDITILNSNNYTDVLKAVHDNIDSYVGTKIQFTGFVYRVSDLTGTQFVLARNMLISSDNRAVVVGFLCNYKDAKTFPDNTWVNITGTITKGNYHGDMPIIEVNKIEQVQAPNDEFVFPPSDSSVAPTTALILN